MLRKFAKAARQRIRLESGGYRRDHLRTLAQRVEVSDGEVRIIGSKSRLLQTITASTGVNAVPNQGMNWRARRDSNPQPDRYERYESTGHVRQIGSLNNSWVTMTGFIQLSESQNGYLSKETDWFRKQARCSRGRR